MKSPAQVVCPTCKSTSSAQRVNRHGFVQRRIYSLFGYYPWKCGACGSTFLYRLRGQVKEPEMRRRRAHG